MRSTLASLILAGVLLGGSTSLLGEPDRLAEEAVSNRVARAAWAPAVWPAPKLDGQGNLLPVCPEGEMLERIMRYVFEADDRLADSNRIKDETGQTRRPYFFYCVTEKGRLPSAGHGLVSFPGQHALFIVSFLDYYVYSGNIEALARAEELADWNIAHSTPLDWQSGGLIFSSIDNGKLGGAVDGDAIQPDKSAIMATAYLRLYRMTGKPLYLKAAQQVGATLTKMQLPEGNWPFRVNPRTGVVREGYTSTAIYAIELFEQLDAVQNNQQFAAAKQKALAWLLNGPVKTMVWQGFFEDIAANPGNRINWDCIDTAGWLIRHRDENKDYLPLALKLNAWVRKTFVVPHDHFAPALMVKEQFACPFPMLGHSLHWAVLLGQLAEATHEEQYRRDLLNIENSASYHLQADNRLHLGPAWNEIAGGHWFSQQFSGERVLLELLAFTPENSPAGENHLLSSSAVVQSIAYNPRAITYTTDAAAQDLLRLAFVPGNVFVDDQPAPVGDGILAGWNYDPAIGILKIAHAGHKVTIVERGD